MNQAIEEADVAEQEHLNAMEDHKAKVAEEHASELGALRKDHAGKIQHYAEEVAKKNKEHTDAVNSHANALRDAH